MKKSFLPALLLLMFIQAGAAFAQAQSALPEPYQEKLLNGLKVLVWNDPQAGKVTLKMRIHAGAMFDPKDKMGVMKMLAEIIFPDPQTRSYFEEDLEGKLEVTSNYDYIEISATGKADEFVNILDTIRAGIVTTPINQDNFVKVRDAALARAKEEEAKPAVIADRAVARRLLGDFPYGRPMDGTPESIAKADRFDLVTAREKFLDADDATLAITGKIDPHFAVKAVRQMLGNWGKSDGLVPPTFAQPAPADVKPLMVDIPGQANAEIRFAARGLASNDTDKAALIFWAGAFEKKINASLPPECAGGVKVSHSSHILPGLVLIGGSFPAESAGKCYNAIAAVIAKADTDKVKPEDFNDTKNGILSAVKTSNIDRAADLWLNADTFKWGGRVSDQLKMMNAATPADGDKVAVRIFWKSPVASVVAGDAAKIKPQFAAGTIFGMTPEQELAIRKDIVGVLTVWKETQEKRDIEAHLKLYAERLEAFGKGGGKTREDVRAERRKTFEQYDSLAFRLDKIVVSVESDSAVSILFDKSWNFRGKTGTSKGSIQQEMKMVKTDGVWQIVLDKDLQTYFVDNQAKDPAPAAKP
jgi:zinc protease